MSNTHATTDTHASHGATPGGHGSGHKHEHAVPLWSIFGLLTLFTALEVVFFEVWSHYDRAGHQLVPKYVMVLVILVALTLPKAAMVLIYFMHLKFEKQLVILVALLPFGFAAIAVLPVLTDIKTLKADGKTYNNVDSLIHLGDDGHGHGAGEAGSGGGSGGGAGGAQAPAAKTSGNAEGHSPAPAEATEAPAKSDASHAESEPAAIKGESATPKGDAPAPKSEEY